MGDFTTPLRENLNRSGIPFQLAVEKTIETIGVPDVEIVKREVPWANGFVDVVARRLNILFAFECKRVDDKAWVLVLTNNGRENQTRCRLEWFNNQTSILPRAASGHSRVFCDEWNMAEESPESAFCIVPKNTSIGTLEKVCRELLAGCHDLLDNEEITHEGGFVPIVPVVITTAKLYTCKFDPRAILDTGKLGESDGQFASVDLVRFRKSLVTVRSNPYEPSKMVLENWAEDRERTVFILTPSALARFLTSFRSLDAMDPAELSKKLRYPS